MAKNEHTVLKSFVYASIGVIMLTGILSAGISTAFTFLSLIGNFLANDIISENKEKKQGIRVSR